jgi:hypothetical protein
MSLVTYIYLVYENVKRYKEYNRFHEISLTTSQVSIKEKYMDKDSYRLEFYEVPTEYAEKVLAHVKSKHQIDSLPVNIRSKHVQETCAKLVEKCNEIMREKYKVPQVKSPSVPEHMLSSAPGYLSSSFPVDSMVASPSRALEAFMMPQASNIIEHHIPSSTGGDGVRVKVLCIIAHRDSREIAVIYNSPESPESPDIAQIEAHISRYASIHLLQYSIMSSADVDTTIEAFHKYFGIARSPSSDLGLPWYKIAEADILQWWQAHVAYGRLSAYSAQATETLSIMPDDFINELIIDGITPSTIERRM